MECWKPIVGFERYEVSSLGRIRSLSFKGRDKVRIMKLKTHKQGYREIGLYDGPKALGGKQRMVLVHKAVLSAFDREPVEGEVCRHIDGDPANNSLENLQWGTSSDNWHDSRGHGTEARCKLTDRQVRSVRARFVKGQGRSGVGNSMALAKEFGVQPNIISQCARRATYDWVKP